MNRFISKSIFTLLWALLSIVVVVAQGTCSELIEQALSEVDSNCEGLQRNNACYGFDLVQAAFISKVAEDFFTTPADTSDIVDIETIATAGLDEEAGIWGVAVMNIQADLPNTIPGQNVTFVLMGDAEIENAVAPEDAFTPADGVEVNVIAPDGANIRSGPGLNFNVIGGAQPDSTLQADGVSEDGDWYRVAHRERPGWANRIVLEENAGLSDLPVLTPDLRTPMQAFYLRTGIGEPECEAAPDDIVLVQGLENIEIELTVNGADVTLGSTIGLRIVEIDGELFLELIVFDGSARVGDVTVYPGYSTLMCLGEPDNLGLDGDANDQPVTCDPTTPQPVPEFGEEWCVLEQVPVALLNYDIEILCPGESLPVVTPIPGGGGTTSQIAQVDCSPFRLVGPFEGITPRPTTFEWTEAPGATDYEIVFYDFTGGFAESFFTKNTKIELNVGQIPTGSELQWEVRAYRDGVYACVTERTGVITRLADPLAPTARASNFTASMQCAGGGPGNKVVVTWSGASSGDTIRLTYNEGSGPVSMNVGTGPSGSANFGGSGNILAARLDTSSGDRVNLGAIDCSSFC